MRNEEEHFPPIIYVVLMEVAESAWPFAAVIVPE